MISFGPDGFLYVGMGDEGGGCDAHAPDPGNGQRLTTLFGKILRLDVDARPTFAAAGNPFTMPTGLPQIFHLGVRNPWRFSFDRATGDFYLGDVGQNTVEEIDILATGAAGGVNFGWRRFEGDLRATTASGCRDATLSSGVHTPPEYVYEHDPLGRGIIHGCSVTGGYVYRGSAIPELDGVYFFGDYCDATVAAFRWCEGAPTGVQRVRDLDVAAYNLVSFGQDNAGEIYIVQIGGRVDRVVRR